MFKAIFWDNDGVLMDTEHLYFQANAETLQSAGIKLTLEMFAEISLRRGESVLALAEVMEEKLRGERDRRYRHLLATESRVMPGVEETLRHLHGRLPMAIVTSCRRPNFATMHERSGLLGYFDFILTREDYVASKPDPEPYLTACARARFNPSECLAVEDSERGVTAAVRAGLTVAAIPGDLNRGGSFAAARWHLTSIAELVELLKM